MNLRRYHDMGGLEAGPVDQEETADEPWHKRVKAMVQLLVRNPDSPMNVDELRRGIEDLSPEDYDRLGYFERWTRSTAAILTEKGVFSEAELDAEMAEIEQRWQRDGPS